MLLSVNVFVSLDGVMQGPGAPDEDRSNGFDRGGWLVPHMNERTAEIIEGWFREADAFLFGRTSYEMLGGHWSQVTAPDDLIATKLNTLPKYVVSRTLTDDEATWGPATVLRGDLADEVRRLKEAPGRELQVHGSWQLAQALQRAGLVDRYRLLQFPVVVGAGKRLFDEGSTPATFTGGPVEQILTPATHGVLGTGEYTVEAGRSTAVLG